MAAAAAAAYRAPLCLSCASPMADDPSGFFSQSSSKNHLPNHLLSRTRAFRARSSSIQRSFPIERKKRRRNVTCSYSNAPEAITACSWNQLVLCSDAPVLVEFWTSWCGPCRMVSRVMDELAQEYAGRIKCFKLDADDYSQVADSHGIQQIPTVLLFKNGEQMDSGQPSLIRPTASNRRKKTGLHPAVDSIIPEVRDEREENIEVTPMTLSLRILRGEYQESGSMEELGSDEEQTRPIEGGPVDLSLLKSFRTHVTFFISQNEERDPLLYNALVRIKSLLPRCTQAAADTVSQLISRNPTESPSPATRRRITRTQSRSQAPTADPHCATPRRPTRKQPGRKH